MTKSILAACCLGLLAINCTAPTSSKSKPIGSTAALEERLLVGDEIRQTIAGYVLLRAPAETALLGEAFYPDGQYQMFTDYAPRHAPARLFSAPADSRRKPHHSAVLAQPNCASAHLGTGKPPRDRAQCTPRSLARWGSTQFRAACCRLPGKLAKIIALSEAKIRTDCTVVFNGAIACLLPI